MDLKNRRILVTGAAGFIGSHLAERLAADNEVLLFDDFSIGRRENLAQLRERPNVDIVEGDVCDPEGVEEVMDGIDVVFHLAISCLRTSLNQPFMSHDINAGGTLNLCLAARKYDVQRVVYVSSSEIYGTAQTVPMAETHPCAPMTVYGASKLAGEHYALACGRTYGLPVSVIRPFNTYGPREPYEGLRAEVIPRFILLLAAGRAPVIYGDGSQTRDFTFVEDTVAGILAAGACDALVGDVVNIACGREVPIAHIAERLAALVTGGPVAPVLQPARPGDVLRHYADTAKARRLLGWAPTVDIDTGLARTVEWFRAERITQRTDVDAAGLRNW